VLCDPAEESPSLLEELGVEASIEAGTSRMMVLALGGSAFRGRALEESFITPSAEESPCFLPVEEDSPSLLL
jgi:hypothetical protein